MFLFLFFVLFCFFVLFFFKYKVLDESAESESTSESKECGFSLNSTEPNTLLMIQITHNMSDKCVIASH